MIEDDDDNELVSFCGLLMYNSLIRPEKVGEKPEWKCPPPKKH